MVEKLFPYKLHLHILQLEEYNASKFSTWIFGHFLTRTTENKKPLVWTQKAKLIYYLALVIAVFIIATLTFMFDVFGLILGIILATQSYFFLIAAIFIIAPLEGYKKKSIKLATEAKLKRLSNVKVIGITGSYGKTSVKEFLYQILRTEFKTLKTPESYNTPYGIAKVVTHELTNSHEYFICEMGAYRRGEIKEICDMVHPQYGILTGINEQHLDTFGSLENTTLGKFELIDALPTKGFGIVNRDNELIKNHIEDYKRELITYGFTDNRFTIRDIKTTSTGTSFELILDGTPHKAHAKLLGNPNIQNILAAATMAYKLNMKPEAIISAIAKLKSVPHRLEIKELEKMTLIDNAYNSNVDGFKESINLMKTFDRPKVFVTPGIVDLGEKTFSIHQELGALLDTMDYIFLVTDSERTQGLEDGITKKDRIIKLNSIKDVWKAIEKLDLKHPVVLLENDLPDNY